MATKAPKKSLKKLTILNPSATPKEIENTIVQEMTASSETELGKYQKMSDKEHILKKPDTYIGSIDMTQTETYVYNAETSSIVQREISYIPGLYKLFDEGAVNSRDHYVRQAQAIADGKPNALPVTYIDFDISEDGVISITNDGNGIDVDEYVSLCEKVNLVPDFELAKNYWQWWWLNQPIANDIIIDTNWP